jgi:hypothetical protein
VFILQPIHQQFVHMLLNFNLWCFI